MPQPHNSYSKSLQPHQLITGQLVQCIALARQTNNCNNLMQQLSYVGAHPRRKPFFLVPAEALYIAMCNY